MKCCAWASHDWLCCLVGSRLYKSVSHIYERSWTSTPSYLHIWCLAYSVSIWVSTGPLLMVPPNTTATPIHIILSAPSSNNAIISQRASSGNNIDCDWPHPVEWAVTDLLHLSYRLSKVAPEHAPRSTLTGPTALWMTRSFLWIVCIMSDLHGVIER